MKTFPIFKRIDESSLDSFIDHAERFTLKKGTPLMQGFQSSGKVFLILYGVIELSIPGIFGKIALIEQGQLLGLIEARDPEKIFVCDATSASNDTVIYSLEFNVNTT